MDDTPTREPRPRWFRLTPGRFVLGLVVVEGFLVLSQQFERFALNKGYTALIALATAAAIILFMLLWFLAALLFRLRFQYSIRSLFVLTAAVAIPCAWVAEVRNEARKQREAVEEIEKAGGAPLFDYELGASDRSMPVDTPPGPYWLCKLLGEDPFVNVTWVWLDGPRVGDAGLEQLKALPQLQVLDLHHTKVTDAGLVHLKGLTQLKVLYLSDTRVTDAGLEHLKRLANLQDLDLSDTKVTSAGVRDLQKALPNAKITWR
jgi:hypothetical protein